MFQNQTKPILVPFQNSRRELQETQAALQSKHRPPRATDALRLPPASAPLHLAEKQDMTDFKFSFLTPIEWALFHCSMTTWYYLGSTFFKGFKPRCSYRKKKEIEKSSIFLFSISSRWFPFHRCESWLLNQQQNNFRNQWMNNLLIWMLLALQFIPHPYDQLFKNSTYWANQDLTLKSTLKYTLNGNFVKYILTQ